MQKTLFSERSKHATTDSDERSCIHFLILQKKGNKLYGQYIRMNVYRDEKIYIHHMNKRKSNKRKKEKQIYIILLRHYTKKKERKKEKHRKQIGYTCLHK